MILGYMSERSNVPIKEVATEGPGLVFVVYPAAIATLPGATFWSLIFFLMLLTLGLDSSFGGSEAVITGITDEFPILKRHRELFVGALFTLYFVIGLASCAEGGAYVVNLFDRFAAGYSILFAVFFESIAVSYAYGLNRFCGDIQAMIGFTPGIYWRICWAFVAPIFLIFITIFGLVNYEHLAYDDYVYPWPGAFIGWCIALSSILCIPGYAIYGFLREKGSFMERWRALLVPYRDKHPSSATYNDVRINGGVGIVGETV